MVWFSFVADDSLMSDPEESTHYQEEKGEICEIVSSHSVGFH